MIKQSNFDYDIKYERGYTNVEAEMLSRNTMTHYIYASSLFVDVKVIFEMQENIVRSKNYKTENGVIIIKRDWFKNKIVPLFLRNKILSIAHKNVGLPSIQKR